MPFIRQGECNWCGECCGVPRAGDGVQISPWPAKRYWPDGLRQWAWADLERLWKYASFIGIQTDPADGEHKVMQQSGNIKIRGRNYPWIWPGDNLPICSDRAPLGDPSTYDLRCPFSTDAGDGTHPCALVGTQYEAQWAATCQEGIELVDGTFAGAPPFQFQTAEARDRWFADYPSCSFTYTWQD